jgi:hypothetical protein
MREATFVQELATPIAIPDLHATLGKVGGVGVRSHKPKQLFEHGAKEDAFCRQQWKNIVA